MSKSLLNGCLLVLLLATFPAFAEDAVPAAEPSAAEAATGDLPPAAEPAQGQCGEAAAAELPWQQPNVVQVQLGCSASYNCVHGTIVGCNSPLVGTCISSGAGCGMVSCNGVATWCPGRCAGDHHCANFCGWDKPDSYCDDFGCCVCVG